MGAESGCSGHLSLNCMSRLRPASTLSKAVASLANGTVTPSELVKRCLQADSAASLNAYATRMDTGALRSAEEADERQRAGRRLGPLDGIPIAVKDNFCMHDGNTPTTAGSKALGDFVAPFDATVVMRLRNAGAIIIGKTNMDEFGMGSLGIGGYGGPVCHPHENGRVPGGSSAGSAVAVATGSCLGSVGSDTGGSVRLPAAYCGIVGIKPTYGRVSRHGLIAYASSLDCPGVHAVTVEDAALLLEAIAGPDEKDPTSAHVAVPNWTASLARCNEELPLKGVRIGIPQAYAVSEMSHDMARAWQTPLSAQQPQARRWWMFSCHTQGMPWLHTIPLQQLRQLPTFLAMMGYITGFPIETSTLWMVTTIFM